MLIWELFHHVRLLFLEGSSSCLIIEDYTAIKEIRVG